MILCVETNTAGNNIPEYREEIPPVTLIRAIDDGYSNTEKRVKPIHMVNTRMKGIYAQKRTMCHTGTVMKYVSERSGSLSMTEGEDVYNNIALPLIALSGTPKISMRSPLSCAARAICRISCVPADTMRRGS